MRPAHPVDAVADQRVESRCGDGAEPGGGVIGSPDAAKVDGFSVASDDHVDGGRRVADRDAVLAGVVVAGSGRDDAERDLAVRQCLQSQRDDAVTAGDHQGIGAAGKGIVNQFPGMCRVTADDLGHVHAAFLKAGDRAFGRVRGVAVTRHRVRQQRDAADLGHGMSLPGFRIPAGSRVCLTARSTATPRSPISSVIHGR